MTTQRIKAFVTVAHRPGNDLSKVVQGPPGPNGGIEIQELRWITVDDNGCVLRIEELSEDDTEQ